MGAGGAALVVLAMMPRVGRRRGGAPAATRRDRDVETTDERDRRFERDEPVANGRTTSSHGSLEDRR
jgi:hypothetical protein